MAIFNSKFWRISIAAGMAAVFFSFAPTAMAQTLEAGVIQAQSAVDYLSSEKVKLGSFAERFKNGNQAATADNSCDGIICKEDEVCVECSSSQSVGSTVGVGLLSVPSATSITKKTLSCRPKEMKLGNNCKIVQNGEQRASINTFGIEIFSIKDNCRTGSDGKTYCVSKAGNALELNYGLMEGANSFRGCAVLPVKLYNQRACFFCPLFAVIYNAADHMAVIAVTKLAAAFATLIALGLGLWIAVQTLTHVSSITKQDAPKFLGNLLKQSFKFLIAFLLLAYNQEIYRLVVIPLLDAGLTFGRNLLSYTVEQLSERRSDETLETINGVFFSKELYRNLRDFVSNVQWSIGFMQAIGTSLMCIGGNLMMGIGGTGWQFGAGFQMAVQGLLLAGFGFLLSLAFAFYLIDAVVQLGIVGALMPFLIACWPFKITSGYTNKGFQMLLNSFFVFVFMGLVVSINLQLIDTALLLTAQTNDVALTSDQQNLGALQLIANAINEQTDEKELVKLTDISGMGFLILVFCCIFGFKFCGQVSSLADKMAGGSVKGIGSSIGTMGASAALSAGKKVAQPTLEAAGDKAKAGAKIVGNGILSAPHKVGQAARWIGNKFKRGGGSSGGDGENGGANPGSSTSGGTSGGNPGGKGKSSIAQSTRTPQQNPNSGEVKTGNSTTGNPRQAQAEAPQNAQEKYQTEFENSELGKKLALSEEQVATMSAAQKSDHALVEKAASEAYAKARNGGANREAAEKQASKKAIKTQNYVDRKNNGLAQSGQLPAEDINGGSGSHGNDIAGSAKS